MSKARLVLTALFVDRQTPTEVARRYGVHRSWVYRLKARFEAEGEAAFEPRSRRPATSPTAIADATVELIVQLRKELARRAGRRPGHHRLAPAAAPPDAR
jgi:transposase